MIGKTLAYYEITSQLGKGGMGEVYQAKDTKLGRDVAIKVLPEEFALDPGRVARFQREAKLLAALNHPNIAAIHGLEEVDGTHFLVMELIPGDTLADRIKAGAIPVEESMKLALQIAEVLEAAHEKGVIHRDLKPANIKVTPEGKVKVLDFGLAKAFAGEQAEMVLSDSPTISVAATQQGIILGTAAYMSPEQATGKSVDKRADIWAFGVVLFEMLTGKKLFKGETVTETIAGVIKSEPEWGSLPPELHPRVRFLLERCLEKIPRNRCSSTSEARVDIQKVLADPSPGSFAAMEPKHGRHAILPWVVALLGIVLTVAAVWIYKPAEPKRVVRFEYELPEGLQFNRNTYGEVRYDIAISPDGNRFVYETTEGLYLRDMDTLEARHITGTDNGSYQAFFSPDGKWIGYWSLFDGKLKKVGVSGGAPIDLCDIPVEMEGASWNVNGTIVFSELTSGVMRVSSNGGTPETLIKANMADFSEEGFPVDPRMLPDGDTLLFTNFTSPDVDNSLIVIQSLRSGKREVLFKGIGARYLPTGHLVYSRVNNDIGNFYAVPFDLDKLKVTGGSASVLEGIRWSAYSNSGTLVYVTGPTGGAETNGAASSGKTLVWVDREGREEPLGAAPKDYQGLNISPDGSKVALTIDDGNQDIWIWDIPHQILKRLTSDKAVDNNAVWTPDGKRIVFYSIRNETVGGIFQKSADGVGEVELLGARPDRVVMPWSFSPDGKFLTTIETSLAPLNVDIGIMSMEGDRDMRVLLKEDFNEVEPRISPDGRYMAYQSDETGTTNIYVRPFPDINETKWQVSSNGGNSPLWSPDGHELFYHNGDATLAVEVETWPSFKHGNPRFLFRGAYLTLNFLKVTATRWDIHHDGKRFLMIKPPAATVSESTTTEQAAAARQPKIIVVTNWFEELKELVPVE